LAVVITHSSSGLHDQALPGNVAVEGFFIISGFYIALILNRKYCFPGATKLFYQQRYLRLAPMYWLAIFCTLGSSAFLTLLAHHPAGKFQIWTEKWHDMSGIGLVLLALPQLTMLGLDALMYCTFSGHPLAPHFTLNWATEPLPAVRFILVPPSWSLSVELLFYISAPLLVRRSVRTQLTVAATAVALCVATLVAFHLPWDLLNYALFPFDISLFLLGSIAFRALPAAQRLVKRLPALRWLLTAGLLLLVFFYFKIPLQKDVRQWGFLACVLCSVPILFAASGRDPVDRWIGEMSYPLYLLHQVTLFTAEPILRRLSGLSTDVVVLMLPLGVAALAYVCIERPFEEWRARRFERTMARAKPAPVLPAAQSQIS
jgi:peptidoglycan/LPS O-acetylase OafA/YrhL